MNRLKRLRKEKNETQYTLAELLSVNKKPTDTPKKTANCWALSGLILLSPFSHLEIVFSLTDNSSARVYCVSFFSLRNRFSLFIIHTFQKIL